MDRTQGAGHINNRFVAEDAQSGRPPTELTAEWHNDVQEEICAVIEGAGIELDKNDQTQLLKAIKKISGLPVGMPFWFAGQMPPPGCLIADGAAVGRQTYPDLFAAIGTTYGEGDGETTFNLPNLIGRFAEGSAMPGTVKEAGLPNATGFVGYVNSGNSPTESLSSGAFYMDTNASFYFDDTAERKWSNAAYMNLSRANPIYGASNTVQPPALTLLPCIKAFDAAVNPGLIDVTALAQEMAGKVDRVINGKNIAYVVDSYSDANGNWWRKWSDGWLEQGGVVTSSSDGISTLLIPFAAANYLVIANQRPYSNLDTRTIAMTYPISTTTYRLNTVSIDVNGWIQTVNCNFYACGMGA